MHLVTPDQMREMDRRTIENVGVPSIVLMERAARGAVDALIAHFDLQPGAVVGLFCGTGNNGGDGLAMASMLAHRGFVPHVLVLGAEEQLSPDAARYAKIAQTVVKHLAFVPSQDDLRDHLSAFPSCAVICDALLGTGLDRPLGGRYAEAVEFLRGQPAPIFAVDIPSGLDARTGQVLGLCATAAATATFGLLKIGQSLDPAREHCGRVYVVDIGIPDSVRDEVGTAATGLDQAWLQGRLPHRALDFHKGRAGRTLHVGGRPGTAGAIALSARGALVGGAGLITVATDRLSQPLIPAICPEVMARTVFESEKDVLDDELLRQLATAADTIVIGPGLGTDALARQAFSVVLDASPPNLVVDADALNLLATDDDLRSRAKDLAKTSALVLTPHPGEQARLQSCSVSGILSDPVSAAQQLAGAYQAVAVLKTGATVVAGPHGTLAINRTGNPGMATGGMGDALTGLVAAAFADFPGDPFQAAACAVCIHGLAGDHGRKKHGTRGLTVMALLDEVPRIWQSLNA